MINIQKLVLFLVFIHISNAIQIPEGLYFQIKNKYSGKCIYSHSGFGVWDCNRDDAAQWWKIINFDGEYFQLQSKHSGKCIYSHSGFGHWDCISDDEPEYFKLKNNGKIYFQIQGKHSGKCMYSHDTGFSHWDCKESDQAQYWSAQFENYEIIDIEYDLVKGYQNLMAAGKTLLTVGTQRCDNTNGLSQIHTIKGTIGQDITHTSEFIHSTGFSITVGTKFKAGVPFVGKKEISISITTSQTFTWGQKDTVSNNNGAEFPVSCAPGEIALGEAMVWKATMDVPYEVTMRTTDARRLEFYSEGTWQGATSWETDVKYTLLELLLETGVYRIKSIMNGRYLECGSNDAVILNPFNDNVNQQFYIVRSNGIYTITCQSNGKYLDILDGSTQSHAKLIQNNYNGKNSQMFKFDVNNDRHFTIVAKHSEFALSIPCFTCPNGVQLVQSKVDGDINQLFRFEM